MGMLDLNTPTLYYSNTPTARHSLHEKDKLKT
jgi:hypothetical protein